MHSLPAGELHPQIDEMAGMVPNTITPPNGGPGIEFPEILFGADVHCGTYDPDQFGFGPPNFGWGPPTSDPLNPSRFCPQHQSGVAGNFNFPSQGTWPVPNRVLREGAFKAPSLRNVELTGPYFHTGSYLTLRQVVDFYFRGGDFPVANADARDPNILDVDLQATSFGRTTGADLITPVNHVFSTDPPFTLEGTFADGLPDTVFLYDEYPDSDHPISPEPVFASREAAMEDAKNAIVKFLLALTDPRVKYERAPFDRPEIFVPISGTAPENTVGRAALLADPSFRHLPEVGAGGSPDPLPNFLGVSSVMGDPGNDHFDTVTVTPLQLGFTGLGVYDNGIWYVDLNDNGSWDEVAGGDATYTFGTSAMIPVEGDFSGDGSLEIGAYENGTWYLDVNGNGTWDGVAGGDATYTFGTSAMIPVVGDWDGIGGDELGAYENGIWYLDVNGNGIWDGVAGGDATYTFGTSSMIPVAGDWDGAGGDELGAYENGTWYLDINGNGIWDGTPTDAQFNFGVAGNFPVFGDWNNSGTDMIGVYDNGTWYLDLNGNGTWDGTPTDGLATFGYAGADPIP
jgi:hypothetical protein